MNKDLLMEKITFQFITNTIRDRLNYTDEKYTFYYREYIIKNNIRFNDPKKISEYTLNMKKFIKEYHKYDRHIICSNIAKKYNKHAKDIVICYMFYLSKIRNCYHLINKEIKFENLLKKHNVLSYFPDC